MPTHMPMDTRTRKNTEVEPASRLGGAMMLTKRVNTSSNLFLQRRTGKLQGKHARPALLLRGGGCCPSKVTEQPAAAKDAIDRQDGANEQAPEIEGEYKQLGLPVEPRSQSMPSKAVGEACASLNLSASA